MKWQPIESAPKNENETGRVSGDCQNVLLLFKNETMAIGYWDNYYSTKYGRNGLCWVDRVSGEQLALHFDQPTHWMPLPPPPEQEGKS